MWDCPACGCQAIAAGLASCPMCTAPKEDDMPKITVNDGPSNRWEDAQTGADGAAGDPAAPSGSFEGDGTADVTPAVSDPQDGVVAEAPAVPAETEAAGNAGASDQDQEQDGPADYESMPLAVLQDLSRSRGLPVSGTNGYLTKAVLAEALREHDQQAAQES